MTILIVCIGLALFLLAFMGLNKIWPTLFGLASMLGLIFGLYLIWSGFTNNDSTTFLWGCILLLGAGSTLFYLKGAFSD